MRGSLSEEKLREISQNLPKIKTELWNVRQQALDVDVYDAIKGQRLGVALVCLDQYFGQFLN